MIVVDTSAIVAIAFAEPERELFLQRIDAAQKVLISTVSIVEARMVVHGRRGTAGVALVDELLTLPGFEAIAPDLAQAKIAYSAFARYGKGSGHLARLNFGDVFSYALARVRQLPLLFKGDDFPHTDIQQAISTH